MNSLLQLDIPKRSTHCAHQGEPLLPGMEIISQLLEEVKGQKIARRDYCLACWNQIAKQTSDHPQTNGHWKSRIEKRSNEKVSSRIERALSLLYQLLQNSESHEEEIFVLCLLLAHARQLVLRKEFIKDETAYHLYEHLKKEEFLTIKSIPLSQVQAEQLQRSLADKLKQ